MAFAVEGFATVAQNYISRGIASNWYTKAPLLAVLGALTLGNNKKKSLEIGRPNSAEILTAKMLSPAEKKQLQGINSYLPRIQAFKTNNTKAMGVRDTMPVVANATTSSHGQAMQAAAKFNWTHLKCPVLIWHEDKIRAGQQGSKEGQGLAMSQLIDEATEVGFQDITDTLVNQIWSGNPTSQTADLWDAQLGVTQMFDTTNTYAQVDRSQGSNAVWKGQKDTVFTTVDIRKIIDDANLTKEVKTKGNGVNLALTTTALYQQFKTQVLASNANGGRLLNDGLPQFAAMGVKQEILQVDNTYVTYDPSTPANNVVCFDLTVLKFMTHPQHNFNVGRFVDLSEASEGAKDADQAITSLRYMFTNDNPFLGVRYTAIGT